MKPLIFIALIMFGCATPRSKITIPAQCHAEIACSHDDGDRCSQVLIGLKHGACVLKVDNPGEIDAQVAK